MPIQVPCGQCIGCRLERSRQWALRCVNEAQLHEDNCFITLTYNNRFLPADGSLDVRHFQKFMKRLRKTVGKVRFFHCGEYGDHDGSFKHVQMYGDSNLGRPHYHAILFGYDFPDKELIQDKGGIKLYTSPLLSKLWPYGFNTVGAVTFESAAYVARYVLKKKFGKEEEKDNYYTRIDVNTGEIHQLRPEYVTMSRRPGIGSDFFKQFSGDVYPKDFITVRGKKIKPPKFYDRLLEEVDPGLYEFIKRSRRDSANARADDNTRDRLFTKEKVKKAQANMLVRPLDKDN